MKAIWFLPLEPLQERYTEQMLRWVRAGLASLGMPFHEVSGSTAYDTIGHGQWLDTSKSTIWKLEQIASLSRSIAAGRVQKGDFVLLGDVWMPGIEAIRFQSDLLGLDLKIGGWHYAGCFDHFDYLARSLGSWAPKYETALIEGVLDSVCFGSPFHRDFVARHCRLPPHVSTCGLAWDHFEVSQFALPEKPKRRRKVIAYTHRWAPEKRPEEFCRLAKTHRNHKAMKFVVSTNGNVSPEVLERKGWAGFTVVRHESKVAYYEWLAKEVDVVWSGADQETFGYSFMEAVSTNTSVAAPNRACYPDHFSRLGLDPKEWLYPASDPCGVGCVSMARMGHRRIPEAVSSQYHNSHQRYIRDFVEAYP